MTGGYVSRNRLRIELFLELKEKKRVLDEEQCKLNDIQQRIQEIEGHINRIQNDYLKADSDHNRYKLMLDNNRTRLNSSTTKLFALQRTKDSNANFYKRLVSSLESMKAKFQALDQELAQVTIHLMPPMKKKQKRHFKSFVGNSSAIISVHFSYFQFFPIFPIF